eukprot:TRINITY_DN915_c0_g1_i1.p1 TRINITY_DN915_c0_g1~~TRINITY_DN915_c0_g1_i1.p1  ORF type:complete len:147 (-),score=12.29 TRINITY_DN915_c0_g1_i1:115-555(-)
MSLKIALVAVLFVAFACGDTVIREEIDSVVPELAEQSDTTASGQMAEAPGETKATLVQEEQKSGDKLGRRGHGRGARRRSSLAQDEDTFGGRKPRRSYRRRSSLVQDEESSEDKVLWGRRRRRRVPAPPVQYRRRSPRNFDSQNGL